MASPRASIISDLPIEAGLLVPAPLCHALPHPHPMPVFSVRWRSALHRPSQRVAFVIAARCICHRSAVLFSPRSSALSNLMASLRQIAAPACFCLYVATPGKKRWNKSEIDVPSVHFHSAEKQLGH